MPRLDPDPVRCWPPARGKAATAQQLVYDVTRALYHAYGEVPHQHPSILLARLTRLTCHEHAVYAWPEDTPRLLIALRRDGTIWQSVFPGAPILADPSLDAVTLTRLIAKVTADVGAEALYFPLAYPDTAAARTLTAVADIQQWQRSPSPVIDWSDRGAGIVSRFRRRHGSQADRKLRRWSDTLTIDVLEQAAAERALLAIEQRSWKASAGIDLVSAGQLDYYRELIRAGLVTFTVARQNAEPVAYRLDLRHRRNVYAVEWSFAAEASRSTPGMFLLTVGLSDVWGKTDLDFVDLFGAPDLLKEMVATGSRTRIDFAWPAGAAVDALRERRQAHDAHLRSQASAGHGIRRTYTKAATVS